VCCSVLQCVAVCCSVLQCVASGLDLIFPRGLGSTYLGGHDDLAVGPTQDRYYLGLDVHQKCEHLRSN